MSSFQSIERALEYESWDPNSETRDAVSALLKDQDVQGLNAILGSRLQFGTAGLRGPMGPGYNRMNELVVLQTCQGLIRYIESLDADAKAKVRIKKSPLKYNTFPS
jgi:phosphoglucomutase / phosphopentomutase